MTAAGIGCKTWTTPVLPPTIIEPALSEMIGVTIFSVTSTLRELAKL